MRIIPSTPIIYNRPEISWYGALSSIIPMVSDLLLEIVPMERNSSCPS